MVGDNFWNFWWGFSIFCEKLQNVCPLAANPDQMDKNRGDFWIQRPPNPLHTSSPQKSCIPVLFVIHKQQTMSHYQLNNVAELLN